MGSLLREELHRRLIEPNVSEIATRKRSTTSQPPRPPRACIVCTEPESEVQLVHPCRTCAMDYCTDCLAGMFIDAITDRTRMPPRCCNLIQIHTILGSDLLSDDQAKAYREKFEEWITPAKTYCPSPTCSVFIPDRKLPQITSASSTSSHMPSLQSFLGEVLEEIARSSQARFFRTAIHTSQAPNYYDIVTTPMDLSIIRKRLLSSHYKKMDDLTTDMRLIVSNARTYNGDAHPITKTAVELFDRYLEEVSKATDRMISSFPGTGLETIFACPKCHIAICTSCKQIEHTGAPCDTSARDHEVAMLETFGYKRCPRCKAGVKKMFGCSHMQCVCGAHWCYYCQRSIDQCDGGCDARLDEDSELDDDGDDGEDVDLEVSEEGGVIPPQSPAAQPGGQTASDAIAPPPPPVGRDYVSTAMAPPSQAGGRSLSYVMRPPPTAQDEHAPTKPNDSAAPMNGYTEAPVNLDAGGPRRWAEGDYNFGAEPDDYDEVAQVWSCEHTFEAYKAPRDDGINRGDLNYMECNRCFIAVQPKRPEPKSSSNKRRKLAQSQGSKIDPILIKEDSPSPTAQDKIAWECTRCKLVVCVPCRDKYASVQKD